MGFLSGLFGGGSSAGSDMSKYYHRGKKERTRQFEMLDELARMAAEQGQPAYGIYSQQFAPLFMQARQAAQDLDVLPEMRGGRELALQNFNERMARMGMSQSGIAEAGKSQIDKQWANQVANARISANAMKQQALQGLSGMALNAGQWSTGLMQRPYYEKVNTSRNFMQGMLGMSGAAQGAKYGAEQNAGGGLGSLLGAGLGLAASFIPGAGPILGPMVGMGASSLLGGGGGGAAPSMGAPTMPYTPTMPDYNTSPSGGYYGALPGY